jgi:hypothetical protein
MGNDNEEYIFAMFFLRHSSIVRTTHELLARKYSLFFFW